MSNQAVNGFLETEIGPIPDGWGVAKLREVVALSKDRANPAELNDVRYVGLEHMDTGSPRLSRWGISSEVRSTKNRFYPGEILYGKLRPYLRKTVLADFEGICSTDILVLRASSNTTGNWLLHLLHTDAFVNHAISTTGGTNLPRTSWTALRDYRFLLPPLPEQRRIAHVLSTIQRAIQTQDAVIAAARELKRSLMHRLFTYGPYAEPLPTKETEIGEVPETWEVLALGKLTEKPQYGYTESAVREPVGPKFLRITDIDDSGRVFWPEVPFCRCSDSDLEKFRLTGNDILVARIGATTGKSTLVGDCPPAVFASYLIRIRSRHNVLEPSYLYQFMRSQPYWTQIDASKGGRLKQGVNVPVLQDLYLPVPHIEDQRLIAQSLVAADRKIEAESNHKTSLEFLFKSMLHQLMTGKLRMESQAVS